MATEVNIDTATGDRLQHFADRRERSPASIVAQAVSEYLDRAEARETFLRDGDTALAQYRATGRHLNVAEAEVWLSGWGTVNEAKAPDCHD